MCENRFPQPRYTRKVFQTQIAASIAAILPLQLVHQLAEMDRQFGVFRAKIFAQPFADATAYRSAGGAIDLFAALVDSIHRGFHFALDAALTSDQVTRAE